MDDLTEIVAAKEKKTPPRRAYHERLVAAFLANTKIADVVLAVDLDRRTVQRWAAVPQWWAEVEKARADVLSEVLNRLRNSMLEVTGVPISVALDPNEPGQVRVRAASVVIETFAALQNHSDLERRMAALELMATQKEKR